MIGATWSFGVERVQDLGSHNRGPEKDDFSIKLRM